MVLSNIFREDLYYHSHDAAKIKSYYFAIQRRQSLKKLTKALRICTPSVSIPFAPICACGGGFGTFICT
jgi:hypothetical protein